MSFIRKFAFVFGMGIVLAAGTTARALTITWDNDLLDGDDTNFNNAANWIGAAVPASGDNATFSGASVANPNLTATDTIQGLTFAVGASGYTLSSSGPALTLTNVGTAATSAINAANTGTNTISAPIILGGAAASTATFTQAAGGALVLSGNI